MSWLFHLHDTQPTAQAIGILGLVAVGGLALGSLKIRGIGLGSAGVLFVGLVVGYFSKPVAHDVLGFVKELGLLLFVFTIGLQLGPGFFAALKREGIPLNAMAACIVLGGATVAVLLAWLLGIDFVAALGVLSGGTTSTPSLGAVEQTVSKLSLPGERRALPALAYAVTYPAAIAGIIVTLIALKTFFRIDPQKEAESFLAERQARGGPIERAGLLVGSIKDLNATQFIPFFLGIALGIIVGTIPIAIPWLPYPVRLGLAGGPLVVALVLGRLGHFGRLVFQMPMSANLAFREFGISLFFAAVGLSAGPQFFASVFSSTGLLWLAAGLCVTVLPLLLFGIVARAALHMNFTTLGGLIAGSVTDPPALAFMNNLTKSEASTLAYVTVYPMATVLRILSAQVLALTLIH